jgi:hypothetical protein
VPARSLSALPETSKIFLENLADPKGGELEFPDQARRADRGVRPCSTFAI